MEALFFLIVVIGIPLDWILRKMGYPDLFRFNRDKPLVMAMARTFRCGVFTIVFFISMLLIIGLMWSN